MDDENEFFSKSKVFQNIFKLFLLKISMPKKSEKKFFSKERFLSDILNNHFREKIHYDTKNNWILGISGLVMGLSFPHVNTGLMQTNLGFAVIFITSLVAFLSSILLINPLRKKSRSTNRFETVMYHKSFAHMNAKEYAKKLDNIDSEKKMIEQYAADILNLTQQSILMKSKFSRLPSYLLFVGVLAGAILILIGL